MRSAAAGAPRLAALECDQIAHDRTGFVAIVGRERGLRPDLQLLDILEPHEPDRFPRDDRCERGKGKHGAGRTQQAQPFRTRIQALDELYTQEPEPEHHEAAQRGPQQRAERKTAPARGRRCRRGRQGRFRRGRDDDAAARDAATGGRAALGLRGREHDVGVVEAERGGLAVAARHGKRSPSRNCRARSSRMCGSVTLPAPVGSSGGGRKRRKR
jgi:hypothetical protein